MQLVKEQILDIYLLSLYLTMIVTKLQAKSLKYPAEHASYAPSANGPGMHYKEGYSQTAEPAQIRIKSYSLL